MELTNPPLKAPTGFLTGAITASALITALVWKLRVTTGALVAVRSTGRRTRDAIAGVEGDRRGRIVVDDEA
jgi:hypothetical protein